MDTKQPPIQESIPLAVGSDYVPKPVRANFPDQTQPEITITGPFIPDQQPVVPQPQKSILDTQPFTGTTHLVLNIPSGTILLATVVLAVAAILIAIVRRKK